VWMWCDSGGRSRWLWTTATRSRAKVQRVLCLAVRGGWCRWLLLIEYGCLSDGASPSFKYESSYTEKCTHYWDIITLLSLIIMTAIHSGNWKPSTGRPVSRPGQTLARLHDLQDILRAKPGQQLYNPIKCATAITRYSKIYAVSNFVSRHIARGRRRTISVSVVRGWRE
ncbi:hypothetical protein ALC62_11753, partial [Cyphomyrmex costatus]